MHTNFCNQTLGARSSPLSRAQVTEVLNALRSYRQNVSFKCKWFETTGDRDRTKSLRTLGKTDFFTKELDEALLRKEIDVAIHSAKDLPDPLPEGLCLAALTRGVDSRDALVLRRGEDLRNGMRIATSSERREEAVRSLGITASFQDVRGTIGERLALLENGMVDGVVIAEAALIRLGLTSLKRILLPGSTVPGQGQLAIVCRKADQSMQQPFKCLDVRRRVLYLGIDPSRYRCEGTLVHFPLIRTVPIAGAEAQIQAVWSYITHVMFTSPSAVSHWGERSLQGKIVLAIGSGTEAVLSRRGVKARVAPEATQEGMIELTKNLDLTEAHLLWPRSAHARPLLEEHLQKHAIPCTPIDLYTTEAHAPGSLPDLSLIDEVVFTSPSTVTAYRALFGNLPTDKVLTPIGPVTAKVLLIADYQTNLQK